MWGPREHWAKNGLFGDLGLGGVQGSVAYLACTKTPALPLRESNGEGAVLWVIVNMPATHCRLSTSGAERILPGDGLAYSFPLEHMQSPGFSETYSTSPNDQATPTPPQLLSKGSHWKMLPSVKRDDANSSACR